MPSPFLINSWFPSPSYFLLNISPISLCFSTATQKRSFYPTDRVTWEGLLEEVTVKQRVRLSFSPEGAGRKIQAGRI